MCKDKSWLNKLYVNREQRNGVWMVQGLTNYEYLRRNEQGVERLLIS